MKPAPDIDWCPFRLHRCSRYNHRTTFRNHSPSASTSINTRLRRASFPLKPAPDIVWCPFPLRHTRNQPGLSAITTHLVSLVNVFKVYNNERLCGCDITNFVIPVKMIHVIHSSVRKLRTEHTQTNLYSDFLVNLRF